MVIHFGESPEKTYCRDVATHEKPLSAQEEQLWKRFVAQYQKQQPKSAEFSDIYSPKIIKNDQEALKIKKMQPWYRERYSRPKLLEALLWHNIEQQNWLGENVNTVVASEEDDVLRGFDFILEAEEKGKASRLGVDVILTDNPEQIYKKWCNNVFAYHLSLKRLDALLIRYFKSEAEPKFRREIQIPRVIIGLDHKHYEQLVFALSGSVKKDIILQEVKNLLTKEISLQIDQLMQLPPNLKEKFQEDLLGIKETIQPLLEKRQLSWDNEDGKNMDAVYSALLKCVPDKITFSKIVKGEYAPEQKKFERI